MTVAARIYKPAKTAMQSGHGNTKQWVLEFEPATARTHDPLMGWTSSRDMRQQVRIDFDTRDEAIAYAERHGIAYQVQEPRLRRPRPKSYAANFRWDRPG